MIDAESPSSTRRSAWGLSNDPEEWRSLALCAQVDAELFFPEKGGSTKEAKLICGLCEVSQQCLKDALDRDERYGIYGGLSERERREILRANRRDPICTICQNPFPWQQSVKYCSEPCREEGRRQWIRNRGAA